MEPLVAPEQTLLLRGYDHRTDAARCLFYEMLAGRPPFFRQPDSDSETTGPLQTSFCGYPAGSPRTQRNYFPSLEKKPKTIPKCLQSLFDLQNFRIPYQDKAFMADCPGSWDNIKTVTPEIHHTGQYENIKKFTTVTRSEFSRGR